jgi:hypothetical protein
MPGLAAPARRVALFMSDTTAAVFTASGTALFDAAFGWAVGATGPSAATMRLAAVGTAGPDEGDWSDPPASGDAPDSPFSGQSETLRATIPGGVRIWPSRLHRKARSSRR